MIGFVFVRFSKIIFIFALAAMLVSHWAVLQTVAWTTMLADNLHSNSLHEALVKTFDGNHPCCLCKAINTGRKAEQKKEFTAPLQKLEFPPLAKETTLISPAQFELLPLSDFFAETLLQKPLLLPPRHSFI
jgi:hypothetical protein